MYLDGNIDIDNNDDDKNSISLISPITNSNKQSSATTAKSDIDHNNNNSTSSDIVLDRGEQDVDDDDGRSADEPNLSTPIITTTSDPNTPLPPPLTPESDTLSTLPTKLCLVTSWGRAHLPDYAYSMFDSISRNNPFVRLKFFYHQTMGLPDNRHARYPNIDFIDISELEDGKYRDQGFPRFLADRLADIYKMKRYLLS